MRTSQILKDSSSQLSDGQSNEKKDVFVRFMKRCGYETVPSQVEGEKEDGTKCSKTVWTLKKLSGCKGASHVSLSFIKEKDKLRLSYPHPFDSREINQIFEFDVIPFLHAYEDSKFQRFTPKDWYLSFDDLFFKTLYPNANQFVRFIFRTFAINPSVVRKCVRQNKGLKRKIDLEVKNSRYFEFLGLERKIIRGEGQNGLKLAKIDVEMEQRAKLNMFAAIKNAAIYYDLNYFKQYLQAYSEFQRANKIFTPLSKRSENSLFEDFSKKVEDYQKQNGI